MKTKLEIFLKKENPVTRYFFRKPHQEPITHSQPWEFKIIPDGFSLEGLKFNLSSLSNKLQNHLRFISSLYLIIDSIKADTQQSYFFKDIHNLTYKLWLSGIENLGTVISQLKEGQCNTTDSDYIPNDLVEIESYYDHGGTVPLYAATLARDHNGETDVNVHQCVSDLIKAAHEAWQSEVTSGSSLGIILGGVGCVAFIAGIAGYCLMKNKKNPAAESQVSVPLMKA